MNESHLRLRRATEQDMMLYFEWANDPSVRQNAFSQEPIPLESHKSWFAKKLADKNTVMYVLENDGVPAGQIRFDVVESNMFEIDFSVAPTFRGRGLGAYILEYGCRTLKSEPLLHKPFIVRGIVKEANTASCQAFLRAGFIEQERDRALSLRHFHLPLHA